MNYLEHLADADIHKRRKENKKTSNKWYKKPKNLKPKKVTTKNFNVNAATLQALQHTIVVAAVDRLAAVQNSQNNEITTVPNILRNCSTINAV